MNIPMNVPTNILMNIPMDPKTFGLLVAILFFLISLLVNLLQRRYSKARLERMLGKEESVVNFLEEMNKYLGKLESTCILELEGSNSPQELGKAIYAARNKMQSTITDMQKYLRSFRHYRQKEKAREKQVKRLEKSNRRWSSQ
jgi:hypothetical protein